MCNTNILLTMGPELFTKKHIERIMDLEINNFRINLGKRNRDSVQYAQNVKSFSDAKLFIDLPTNRPRTANQNELFIEYGEIVYLCEEQQDMQEKSLKVSSFSLLNKNVNVNEVLCLDDGKCVLRILDKNNSMIKCKSESSTYIKIDTSIQSKQILFNKLITSEDEDFFRELYRLDIVPEYVLVSFVRSLDDIITVKRFLSSTFKNKSIVVIPKIETSDALNNLDNILENSDLILLARGDLLNSISPNQLYNVQQNIYNRSIKHKKGVIHATQVLLKHCYNQKINASELIDIYIAIINSANYIMLSGESGGHRNSYKNVVLLKDIIEKFRTYK